MKTDFWKEKWKAGEIGFHRDAYNPNLLKWWHRVEAEKHDVVLVPLCGKTLDLRWLAGGNHAVIGAEVSSVAVNAFLKSSEQNLRRLKGMGSTVSTNSVDSPSWRAIFFSGVAFICLGLPGFTTALPALHSRRRCVLIISACCMMRWHREL